MLDALSVHQHLCTGEVQTEIRENGYQAGCGAHYCSQAARAEPKLSSPVTSRTARVAVVDERVRQPTPRRRYAMRPARIPSPNSHDYIVDISALAARTFERCLSSAAHYGASADVLSMPAAPRVVSMSRPEGFS